MRESSFFTSQSVFPLFSAAVATFAFITAQYAPTLIGSKRSPSEAMIYKKLIKQLANRLSRQLHAGAARMRGTATWAGDWCKVVASFKSNFWRASVPRDSGVSQPGRGDGALLAVTWEAADSNDLGEGGDCLAGVNFGRAACARLDAFGPHADPRTGRSGPELRAAVAWELGAVFGEEVIEEQLLEVYHQAWIREAHTWRDGDEGKLARGDDPRRLYGHEALRRPTAWGVHFAGTETEAQNGHVEGAIRAGERAAAEVLDSLADSTVAR